MQVYLARRYFQMDRQQWFELPWYEAQVLLDGLRAEGILGGEKQEASSTPEPKASGDSIDIANADLSELGFLTTRRAG